MNNSTRSIFTDVRFTSRYSQEGPASHSPTLRRSISESGDFFVQSPPTSVLNPYLPPQNNVIEHGNSEDSATRASAFYNPRKSSPSINGRKRRPTSSTEHSPRSGSARKKKRQDTSVFNRRLSHGASPGFGSGSRAALPSPLFFSHSPSQRPQLPPRFSSSEAGAKMLSKAQGEDRTIRRVTLARGSVTSAASPTTPSRPAPRAIYSSEPNSFSRNESGSPDLWQPRQSPTAFSDIGLVELLEHDPRPTCVLDLADTKNFHSENLHILYGNPAFYEKCTLRPSQTAHIDSSVGVAHCFEKLSAVKAWIFALAQAANENPKISSVLEDGSTLWSCAFPRRNLIVVSGVENADFMQSSRMLVPTPTSTPSVVFKDAGMKFSPLARAPTSGETPDYFGLARGNLGEDYLNKSHVAGRTPDQVAASPTSTLPSLQDSLRTPHTPTVTGDMLERYPAEHVLSAAAAGNFDTIQKISDVKEVGFFDWTRLPVSSSLPQHIQFARSVDWANTALGPIEDWSPDLRQMCNLIMASPHPAAMYWGEQLVAIYNEAYVLLAGQKHPALMGQSYRVAWAEIWDEVKEVFNSAQTTGQATMKDDDCLFIRRNDFLEETYFSWSIIPLVGEDGSVMGLYNPAFEKTRRKIAERRMLTLREIGERTSAARDVSSFWAAVLQALDCNEFDTPFVLLYSLHGEGDFREDSSIHSSNMTGFSNPGTTCSLEGALGVPQGHPAAPVSAEMSSDEGYVPIFREVQKTNRAVVLDSMSGSISPVLLEKLNVRGFSDPVQSVVVCPIHPTTHELTLGFLVLGVNPRRPFDEDYHLFVQLLGRQLATSLASVVLFENEIKRGQQAAKEAALDKIELSEQLAARTEEAIESETKFTNLANFVPVGVFIGSSEGIITYCNESWLSISQVPPNNIDKWIDFVKKEDMDDVRRLWHDLTIEKKSVSAEFRFASSWTDRNGVKGDTWVLFSAYPDQHENGSVFGSITHISNQKWAEELQKRKMQEAVELKRQQENFIDITSHEMRNPLSAILQCADEIIFSLSEKRNTTNDVANAVLFDETVDAAHTIALCAQHQKRIVDDILTLSKLDSALLMVTPVDVQPITVAQRALKMFEGEVQSASIDMQFRVDASLQSLDVDWCKFDPSRVLQVLINLTTNAIKFTTSESRRDIIITLAASTVKFSELSDPVVSYFPSRPKKYNSEEGAEWGDGEEIYIQFAVQDTGRGLSTEEKKMLFMRFSQASPRTHVQYGGSGLGLFISRELTELQHGQIGVASEAGKGSTFAFFIKARKTIPPSQPLEQALGMSGRQTTARRLASRSQIQASSANADALEKKKKKLNGALKVLIVEDNLVNQKVLQRQLRNMGCETHVANHGGEALDRLRDSWFAARRGPDVIAIDVVLMDQEMPVMDGLTCTKKIRELEQSGDFTRHIPVIAVTANARVEQITTAREAGMDDVVNKPFRIQELIPKMEELTLRYQEAADA
ncbi:MAG: hypothetical protein Q9162_006697 [Coniocarpon cinnabarinum]